MRVRGRGGGRVRVRVGPSTLMPMSCARVRMTRLVHEGRIDGEYGVTSVPVRMSGRCAYERSR